MHPQKAKSGTLSTKGLRAFSLRVGRADRLGARPVLPSDV
nr:MAG TPA: hypothetical protein [Caudoviricetes sp.]